MDHDLKRYMKLEVSLVFPLPASLNPDPKPRPKLMCGFGSDFRPVKIQIQIKILGISGRTPTEVCCLLSCEPLSLTAAV